jgi:hypothetical protein
VRAIAVQLDHEALGWPEEVHDEGANANVHFGLGKTVAAADGQETPLQLAASPIGREIRGDRKSKELRLAHRGGESLGWQRAAEVREGARSRGDRYAETAGSYACPQVPRAVDDDSSSAPASLPRNRHVGLRVKRGGGGRPTRADHALELSRAGVAEDCPLATGQGRSHPPSRLAQPAVPYAEDPAMNAV